MIEQRAFSKLIKEFLEAQYPDFIPSIMYQDDGAFTCCLKSPSNIFSIDISTENSEITIGLDDPKGDSGIHTHIECREEEDIEHCISFLAQMINDIQNDQLILYLKTNGKYDWIDVNRYQQGKHAERFSWK